MSARASLIYLGARAAAGVLSLLAVSLFARGLGPEGYGWLALCTTAAAILSSLIVVPAGQTLARYLPRAGFEALLPTLARGFLLLATLLMVGGLLLEWLGWHAVPRGVPLGATALLLALGMFELSAQFANSRFQPERYSALFLFKAVGTLAGGGLVLSLGGGSWSVLLVMILASLWICRDAWLSALRTPAQPALLREVRHFALMLACISGCAGLLQWSDRWLLAILSDAFSTGAYGATADLVAQTMMMLSSAFFLAWYPRMVAAWEGGGHAEVDRLAARYLGLSLSVMLPAMMGFSLLRDEIVALFLGAPYAGSAAKLVPWLAAAAAIGTLRTLVFDVSLFISGRLRVQLRNAVLAALCGLLLSWWLVPRVGSVGAAMANVCAQSLGVMLSWWSGRGLIAWRVTLRDLLAVPCATGLMVLCVLAWPSDGGVVDLLIRVLLGLSGYVFGMLFLNGLGGRDWLWQYWRSRPA